MDRIALAGSTAQGAFFVAVLTCTYLPAALVLRTRAGWLAERELKHGTAAERETWLAKAGLASSPFQELGRLFVTVSPRGEDGTLTPWAPQRKRALCSR